MPIIQLPLMRGIKKDSSIDYIDALPINMLATPKEVLESAGYLRSFPGLAECMKVNGISRGALYNTQNNQVYRVLGNALYSGEKQIATIKGDDRVSMAFSYNSHAVVTKGRAFLYCYDGETKQLSNWESTDYLSYPIDEITDICRFKSRYILATANSDTFYVTDLEDESKPDRYRAAYRAESQPDGIQAVDVWRDFIVTFGTATIEFFALTGAADALSSIYVAQPSLMIEKGIAGKHCKAKFSGSFAFISHPSTGAPSVYMMDSGNATQIATATIEKILRGYTEAELSEAVMESLRFDSHELLIIHLLRHTLCYDLAASQSGMQWSILKSGLKNDVYRGIDFVYENNKITLGDKKEGVIGSLDFQSSAQYGELSECILYTPMLKVGGGRVFDFELESSTGAPHYADTLFISITPDGVTYSPERLVSHNEPLRYDKRILWRRIGRIRRNIGFKVRVITKSPITLSGCQIRIE